MNRHYTAAGISARICFLSACLLTIGAVILLILFNTDGILTYSAAWFIASILGCVPAFIILSVILSRIQKLAIPGNQKVQWLLLLILFVSMLYGLSGSLLFTSFDYNDNARQDFLESFLAITGTLFACSCIACLFKYTIIQSFFSQSSFSIHQNKINMESNVNPVYPPTTEAPSENNKTLIKGIITGILILVMLIPTLFIENLVKERQDRREDIVKEVSSKWASAQTVTGPYLVIPYNETQLADDGKKIVIRKNVIVLPDDLNVNGTIIPEERSRSIYQVLLYRSSLSLKGSFHPSHMTKDIDINTFMLQDAKICMGVTDFKGIEDKISININNEIYDLQPGLPVKMIDKTGLFAGIPLTSDSLNKNFSFSFNIKLRGSGQLHFVPLSANSKFNLQSSWPNPSFDGNTLPNDRTITKNGFDATWQFNQANLPYTTIIRDAEADVDIAKLSFGVNMVQPADQYAKTLRSAKYAILFIGLTFALFFIIELLQNRPVHPVQYILVGIALTIFYTLLLAISEIILFDYAYLIAATATVLLITFYVKNHFRSWKIAAVFTGVLTGLYGFIFILISLEDTALLVGSIALFIVLALIMYASRNVNWYDPSAKKKLSVTV